MRVIDRTRILTFLAVAAGVAMGALAIIGEVGGLMIVVPIGLATTAVAFRLQRAGGGLDAAWTPAGAGADTSIRADAPTHRAPPHPAPPHPATDVAGERSVEWPLARVEARLLLWSPWFAVGVGFCVLLVAMFGVAFVADVELSWAATTLLAPLLVHPLCGCTIVAVHRAVTRSRRHGTEELFTSCPAGWSSRTRAHLLTAYVPLIAGTVFLGTLFVLIATRNPRVYGPVDAEAWLPVVMAVVLPVGAVALGTALGRWTPWALAPYVAVGLIAYVNVRIGRIGAPGTASDRWLATGVAFPDVDLIWFDTPSWEPLLWLGGLTVVVAAIALARDDRSRLVLATIGAGTAVALVGAVLIVRPIPEDRAAHLAATVQNPSATQSCQPVDERVEVCVFGEYTELGALIADEVAPVAAAMPERAEIAPATFRLLLEDPPEQLPAEVAVHLPALLPPPPEGTLRLRFQSHPETLAAARLRLGAHAVGLPTEAVSDRTAHVVAGEARGVIALWLATRGLDRADARAFIRPSYPHAETASEAGQGTIWPGTCHGEDTVLVWPDQDLDAARQLIEAPEDDIAALLESDWSRWVDPATTTDELLAAAGLDPVGPPDHIEPLGDPCF